MSDLVYKAIFLYSAPAGAATSIEVLCEGPHGLAGIVLDEILRDPVSADRPRPYRIEIVREAP